MPSASLLEKIDPDRYPNMSLTFVAILGYVCGESRTQPVILSIEVVDPTGGAVPWPSSTARGRMRSSCGAIKS